MSDMFTVFASRNNEDAIMHTYLLLSRADSTMVNIIVINGVLNY